MAKQTGPYRAQPEAMQAFSVSPSMIVAGEGLPTVRVIAHNGTSAYITAGFPGDGGADEPVVIHGVAYRLNVYMAEQTRDLALITPPPVWGLQRDEHGRDYNAFTLSRVGSFGINDGSPAARTFVREVVAPALAAWLSSDEGRALSQLGAASDRADRLRKAQERVKKAEAELQAAQAERDALIDAAIRETHD